MKLALKKLIRGVLIGFLVSEFTFSSWLVDPNISPVNLFKRTAYAQEQDDEGESDPGDDSAPTEQELADPEFNRTLHEIDQAVKLMERPLTKEGKLILDPRDAAILRAHLDPETYQKNTSNVAAEDEETFKQLKTKLAELGFDSEQGVVAVLADEGKKEQVLSLIRETQGKVFTDRSNAALVTLERMIEENREAVEIADFLDAIVFASALPGGKLVEKTKDIFPLDRRVVDALAWLIFSRSQGGGGHERIKIARIWKTYTARDPKTGKPIPEKTISQETEGADNVSLHAKGQAIDISEIETIKCTKVVVKKGIIRRKVKRDKIPPKPIKVGYQTDQGVAQEQPPGLSFNELIQNLMQTALLDTLSEFDVTDLGEEGELRYATLQDMADFVGRSLVEQLIGGKGLHGSSIRESVELFGRAALADRLGLPRAAIEGNEIDEIETSVGRFSVEQRLRLPIGSLRGKDAQEIFTSAGRRRIEAELGLRDRTLEGAWNSRQQLEEKLGQAMVETKLKLALGSFGASDLGQLKQAIGDRKFAIMFGSSPNAIDELVGLPYGRTSALLLQGQVAQYKREIGASMIASNWELYRQYEDGISKLDRAYDVPKGTMAKFINGDQSTLPIIGRQTLTRAMSTNDYDQGRIGGFFDDPNLDWQLPERTIMTVTGFRTGEFARVFSGEGGDPVFQRIGKSRLIQAVLNTPETQRAIAEKERELLAGNPEIMEAAASFEFRRQRFQDLQNRINGLDRLLKDATSNPAIGAEVNTIRSALNEVLRRPLDFRSASQATKRISKSLDAINAVVGPIQNVSLRNQIEQELVASYQDIEAIITGELPRSYRDINVNQINPAGAGQRRSSSLISARDLFDWLNGKRGTKDMVLSVGARQIENSLDLPPLAIFYTLKERQQNPDTFFRSVGRAHYEQFFGNQPIRIALTQNGPDRIDAILRIGAARRSVTTRLAASEITEQEYFEKVGKQVLLVRGVSLLGINVDIGGLVFTPYDIYDMLSGNGRPIFERIAAQKFEQAFDLPQHVFWRLLKAPSADDKRLAMAEVASYYFGNLLGLGPLPVFGVPEEVSGRYSVETALGLQPGTFRDSLDKVIERNGAVNFALAFRMTGHPDGLALEGYDAGRLADAINVLSLPETITTVAAQEQARQYLNQLDGDPLNRNSGAWGVIEQFRTGQVNIEDMRQTIELLDEKLRIGIGSTDDLLRGRLSVADYAKRVGGFSLADNLARSPVLIDRLADALGLEGIIRDNFNAEFPIVFDLLRRNSVTEIGSWRPEDRQTLYGALDTLFSLRFDSKLGARRGTFALLASQPGDARKVLLSEGVFKMENQMGLNNGVNDGPLTRVYNTYTNADQALRGQAAMDQAENELAFGIQAEVFKRTADRGEANGVSMPLDDIKLLINGDMRFIGLVAAADMAGSLNKDRDGNLLPFDRQISYQVIADAFREPPQDTSFMGEARGRALEQAYQTAREFDLKGEDADNFAKTNAQFYLDNEISKLRSERKREFQYRLADNQLYKVDINVPAGFARAMFEGTTEQRTHTLLNYAENLVNNHKILGVPLPRGSLVAVEQYVGDPSQHNFDRLVSTGALSTFDQFIIDKKLFGDFWLPGTAEALFRYGRTSQLGNVDTAGTIVGLYGQWALVKVFNFMDAKMAWQIGSAAQIYFATRAFLQARAQFDAIRGAFGGIDLVGTGAAKQLTEAKAALITVVVSIVFAKQISKVEQAIGLVPGTGSILISMGIYALMGAALNPVTLGLFILLNLFGFNRVKIFVLCNGNGNYPQLESTNPELDVGLGEFNGMSATEYREGLKQAARRRVNALISDMMEMPYYFIDQTFVGVKQDEPDFSTKPAQIITARQEDLLAFFGSDRYKQVFNEDPTSNDNRQGIIISPKVTEYVHIGF